MTPKRRRTAEEQERVRAAERKAAEDRQRELQAVFDVAVMAVLGATGIIWAVGDQTLVRVMSDEILFVWALLHRIW